MRFHGIILREVGHVDLKWLHRAHQPVLAVLGRPTAYHTRIQHPSSFSNKRCHNNWSLFIRPSKCCSSSSSTTWLALSTPAQSRLSTIAHSSRTHAPVPLGVEQYGILFGAALSLFSHARGLLFTQIFRVLRRGRRRIVLNDGYGTQFSRLPSTAFRCSYVRCSYPSTC